MWSFVEKEKGILGASPDGLATGRSNLRSPQDALIRKSICNMSDTGLKVNKSHMYFYQVQQQLSFVNRLWGVLAILGSNGEFFHEEIAFQLEWWKEKLTNIKQFYDKYIIYELAYPRIRDGLTRM